MRIYPKYMKLVYENNVALYLSDGSYSSAFLQFNLADILLTAFIFY